MIVYIFDAINMSHEETKTNNEFCLLTVTFVNPEPDLPFSYVPKTSTIVQKLSKLHQ